jgi:hypothetical protein
MIAEQNVVSFFNGNESEDFLEVPALPSEVRP